jgi:addiction module HigA family antidote
MLKRAVHPGVILKDELDELGVPPTFLARQIEGPPNRISQIIAGKRSVTVDTALRLGQWFGIDPQFWMNLQTQFDLATAERRVRETVRALPTTTPGVNRSPAGRVVELGRPNRKRRFSYALRRK